MARASSSPSDTGAALAAFSPVTQAWFAESFTAPTRVQALGWQRIATGAHTLMLAPTGSGKTLAAFLACLDRLTSATSTGAKTRVIYVSPIKALAYDVERNLLTPLAGLAKVAAARGETISIPRIDVRTGDTPQADRRKQLRDPGEILITTPESLYLLLGSSARGHLDAVETVIIDEIHAVAATKRGVHLALSLERLSAHCARAGNAEPQRIGLSATQKPLSEIARYLGGDREVAIVDAGEPPAMDLQIIVPAADMTAPPSVDPATASLVEVTLGRGGGMWQVIIPTLLDLVLANRSTIIFVNNRRAAERLATQITELARARGVYDGEAELVRAHHGSVSRLQRLSIEEALKRGELRAITATSSLELGIDMGAVDLVVQVESPGGVARGLQRVGRAGHQVGATSRGRIVPKFRADLLEAAACVRGMLDGAVEIVRIPENCLDVLAQQLVAMCTTQSWTVDELQRVVTRCASFRDLGRASLTSVLDMLSGRYASDEFSDLRPRLTWDRANDVLTARPGARLLSVFNAGTIPDRGLYPVHIGQGGPRVGELDEEMVYEARRGETFLLGATTWRIEDITRDRVIVSPAPGEPGKMPFWHGEGPSRPIELGRAVGELTRQLDELATSDISRDDIAASLAKSHKLDRNGTDNLLDFVSLQRTACGAVPTDKTIVVERFRDELGDWRVCILSPLGGRVHAPWAHVLSRRFEDRLGYPVHPRFTNDGIAFRFVGGGDAGDDTDANGIPDISEFFPAADEIEEMLVAELTRSARFASLFRENAGRALLLPKRRPGLRTPLWTQRQKAQQLMGVALRYPSFPIVLETFRECLRDAFDLPALRELLTAVAQRDIDVVAVTTTRSSPFATSLVFDYIAAFIYDDDAPAAERRAQALTLDRGLLRELLGQGELRELLDPVAIDDVEDELAGRVLGRQARTSDELADLLRRVGDLDEHEIATRIASPELSDSLAELQRCHRVVKTSIGGASRWIAVEDAARYRDVLGVELPSDLPAVWLAVSDATLAALIARFARTHGPFTADELIARWQLDRVTALAEIDAAVTTGSLIRGELRPGGTDVDLCDAEVLRRIRKKSLARLRQQVAPIDGTGYARFLARWQHVGDSRRGLTALRDTLIQLEGMALPFADLEARLLPARLRDFSPRLLDELGAMGELVWVGRGALGTRDGHVAILRRERAELLLTQAERLGELPDDASTLHRVIVEHLRSAGASFLVAIQNAADHAITGLSRDAVKEALWQLVWAGIVTNDTFAPLRNLRVKASGKGARAGKTSPQASFSGRWSLVTSLLRSSSSSNATQRLHALAVSLLDRWGVVSRECALADDVVGGFAALVPVLDTMEEAGTVRRGYFVAGLSGRQYAWAGAVDRLRADAQLSNVIVLSAVDPANPWGAVLPWPKTTGDARPARRGTASVVLVDGAPALHVEPGGGSVLTFSDASDDALMRAFSKGLPSVSGIARRALTIESIDGAAALSSRWAPVLDRAGLRRDYRGFVAITSPVANSWNAPPDEQAD